MPKLSDRSDTDEYPVLVDAINPAEYLQVGRRSLHLRQHVGIEQEVHSVTSRGLSRWRSSSRSAPRSGDASRDSARVPLRWVLRAHSSAETITALGLPLRVMVWGPTWARSTTSESRALAPARVHVPPSGGEGGVLLAFVMSKP